MAISLLTAFAASLVVLGRELSGLFSPRISKSRRIEWIFAILGGFAAGVLTIDCIDESHFIFDFPTRLLVDVVGLGGFLAIVLLLSLRLRSLAQVSRAGGKILTAVFFTVFALMAVIAYARFSVRNNPDFTLMSHEFSIGQVAEDHHWVGETDAGTRIPLFHFDADDKQFQSYAASFEGRFPSFKNILIARQTADKEANCHGWVFTGGKFLIRGEHVETILKENGYRNIKEPAAGDIIIYRSVAGNILHTALVQAVLNDKTVLAESKWGIDQRFIHLPEHQPYSNDFTYYRTDRRDNRILVHRLDSPPMQFQEGPFADD